MNANVPMTASWNKRSKNDGVLNSYVKSAVVVVVTAAAAAAASASAV